MIQTPYRRRRAQHRHLGQDLDKFVRLLGSVRGRHCQLPIKSNSIKKKATISIYIGSYFPTVLAEVAVFVILCDQ